MTTNQTINGVPRELRALLERIVEEPRDVDAQVSRQAAVDELRALLDAPVCSNCAGLERNVPCPDCKPAAHPQGEPVPITGDMNRLMVAYKNGEFSLESGSETVEAMSVASFDTAESHGHDADSYMSGYCAAIYEQAKPFVWLALQPKAEQPAPVAFPGYPPAPEDRKLPVAVVRMCDCNQGRMPCNGKCKP